MPQESAGSIGLDLEVNQKGFNQAMNKIKDLAQKAGKALAGAFAVKSLINFGQSCIDLGSDLTEVQNVVEQSFGSMTGEMDKWAKSAATQFGLSETMAKRYAGTFGAMSKAFGFTEKDAYDMSTTLTGLAGDVASFYNVTQDDAYTKLKGVFTGETEGLKSLGVVMTQAALDEYALANGFGKVTAKMTEQEKVALRYQFVQAQLSTATGDFARTAGGSWANQVRIFTLQMESLKATIGQGLINLFLPVIKMINMVIGKLAVLAEAFRSFTELITGKKASAGNPAAVAAETATAMDGAADSAGNLADNTTGVGKAAQKAAKAMRSLMGFDQINKLDSSDSSDTASGGSGSGSAAGAAAAAGGINFGGLAKGDTALDETERKTSKLIERMKELAKYFQKGFTLSFGDSGKRIDAIKTNLNSIGTTLKSIFTNPQVVASANNLLNSWSYAFGAYIGAIASIGVSIAANLTGGFAEYLAGSQDYISERLAAIFDAGSALATLTGQARTAIADILTVLAGPNATGCTAALIGIFSDAGLGITEVLSKEAADLYGLIVQPVIDNAELIKQTIDGLLGNIKDILTTLWRSVQETIDKLLEIYNEHVKPLIDALKDGISSIIQTFLEMWQKHIQPVLDELVEKFTEVWQEHVQPMINSLLDLVGDVVDLVKVLWQEYVQPFINWLIETLMPIVAPIIRSLGAIALAWLTLISDSIGAVADILGGLIEFITGVLSGDWNKAFNGLGRVALGFKKGIDAVIAFVKDVVFDPFIQWFEDTFGIKWEDAVDGIMKAFNDFKIRIGAAIAWVQRKFGGVIKFINDVFAGDWESAWEDIKDIFEDVFDGLADLAKVPINAIISAFNGVIDVINGLIEKINSIKFSLELPGWLQDATGWGSIGFDGFNLDYLGKIQALARGGYVKANTPQLAMIGDNKHQGEIVAPEDKLREMAREAAAGGNREVIALLQAIFTYLQNIDPVELDPETIRKYFIRKTNQNTRATGQCEIVV